MQQAEQIQVDSAFATLGRMRSVQAKFQARWTRLDDLPPEDERSLKDALQAAWETWAAGHGVTEAEVRGPTVAADYFPISAELPG